MVAALPLGMQEHRIDSTTHPIVARVLLAQRDRFDDWTHVPLTSVIVAIARSEFARGYDGPAIGNVARKCLPDIDAAIAHIEAFYCEAR